MQAIRERVGIVELQAKLMGEIQTGNRSVTVNLQAITPEEAIEYARDILALFGPVTEVHSELPRPLIEGEADMSALKGRRLSWAGQYQQRPAPVEGNIIRRSEVRYYGGIDPKTDLSDEGCRPAST